MKKAITAAMLMIWAYVASAQNFATQYNGSGFVNCGSSISNTIASGTKLTLETRFRMTTTPGSWDTPCGTYHSGSWTDGGFGFFYNGSMSFYIFNYSSNVATAAFNSSNTSWHHLAGTWDKTTGTINIYLDGVLAGTDNYTGTIGPITADIFQIGAAASSYQWKGQLDEVRIWNVVRTQAEIQSAMNTQLAGNEAGLISYYKMEEGIGTSLTDNSGHGNTGTMTAGVTWVGAPTISSISPASGPAGTTVTINGNLFTGTTAVTFGGTAATSINVVSATQITAVVGAGSTGDVVVNAPGGSASYTGFTFIGAPTITSFAPLSASTGTTVTITGTNFTNASAVRFGGTAATSFNVVSPTSITAVVSTGTTGTVSVTTPGGSIASGGTFTHLGTLPVTLVSFTGEVAGNANLLKWITATETNNDHFVVQRSADGLRFIDHARVAGQNNTMTEQRYYYQDQQPLPGMNYYRLKQVDMDGSGTYSAVIAVFQGSGVKHLSAYPNPVTGGQLNLYVTQAGLVTICDLSGERIFRNTLTNGLHQIDVSRFSKGIYHVQCGKETLKILIVN